MKVRINPQGTWDIYGDLFRVSEMAPSINGERIIPLQTEVLESGIIYHMINGCINVIFDKDNDGSLLLGCRLEGPLKLHDISFAGTLSMADPENCRAFVQGFGMEGPSGYYDLAEEVPVSNGLLALQVQDAGFYVYAVDHTRFTMRCKVHRDDPLFGARQLFSAGFNLEGIPFESLELPPLFFREMPECEPSAELEKIAGKIASFMGARHEQPPAFHWCSWYYQYQNMSQDTLEEYLNGFSKYDPDFRYIQLDAGYCQSLGDWLVPSHRFPGGLSKAAEMIRQAGYEPGIWVGPFMVGDQSRLYKEHPDWILKDLSGHPVVRLASYNEPKCWGNPDCNYYVLDTSHPDALDYLRQVFETLHGWGYRLFKTDFMLWNMHDTSTVDRWNKTLTSVEILRKTLKVIRGAIGEESYLLGCIAPFLPFIGYADGMRIAGDVGAQWEGEFGPENMLREITADNYFNGIYWQNDPDCILLRDFDTHLSKREIFSLALLQALSGGAVTVSDPLHRISDVRRKLLSMIRPDEKYHQPVIPGQGKTDGQILLLHHLEHGKLLFVMNHGSTPLKFACRFNDFFEEKTWYVCDDRSGAAGQPQDVWIGSVAPHDHLLLFLSQKPFDQVPQNLWKW